jgi:hypothetical protein
MERTIFIRSHFLLAISRTQIACNQPNLLGGGFDDGGDLNNMVPGTFFFSCCRLCSAGEHVAQMADSNAKVRDWLTRACSRWRKRRTRLVR